MTTGELSRFSLSHTHNSNTQCVCVVTFHTFNSLLNCLRARMYMCECVRLRCLGAAFRVDSLCVRKLPKVYLCLYTYIAMSNDNRQRVWLTQHMHIIWWIDGTLWKIALSNEEIQMCVLFFCFFFLRFIRLFFLANSKVGTSERVTREKSYHCRAERLMSLNRLIVSVYHSTCSMPPPVLCLFLQCDIRSWWNKLMRH